MKEYYEFDKDIYMVFVNYKQAYDSVNRQELWKTKIHFGKICKLIKKLF